MAKFEKKRYRSTSIAICHDIYLKIVHHCHCTDKRDQTKRNSANEKAKQKGAFSLVLYNILGYFDK